jgi:Xaa-Pro aminopeptidase
MTSVVIGRTEREVCNSIESGLLANGMQWLAYETIVGTGSRSALLHARATDRVIAEDDVVMIDAGGEWRGYCSDITRTFPAGQRYTGEQRAIYELVLTAQKLALGAAQPGQTLVHLNQLAQDALRDGLARLGLVGGGDPDPLKSLMPHSTSHWIGLDVHDPSPYHDESGEPVRLQPGMCFTVEPGLYLAGRHGVRIEDDVLITPTGSEVLSSVPKEIEEIEEARAHATRTISSSATAHGAMS